jgi:hypothetical protein
VTGINAIETNVDGGLAGWPRNLLEHVEPSVAPQASLAAAAPLKTGLAVAIPFALLFVASTLAVRVVILRVRGGGDHRSTRATRRGTLAVAGSGLAVLGVAVITGALSPVVLVAAAPGLLTPQSLRRARRHRPIFVRSDGPWSRCPPSLRQSSSWPFSKEPHVNIHGSRRLPQ